MPGLSLTNSIVSIFTYVQNLGATVNLPKFELPETFVKAINVFSKFLFLIVNYLPKIPAYDVRAQLVFLSLGIPLILDILFIWFVNPLINTIIHLLDILSLVMCTFMVTEAIIIGLSKGKIYVIALGCVYLVVRLILIGVTKCVQRKREEKAKEDAQDHDEDDETPANLQTISSPQNEEDFTVTDTLNDYVKRICNLFMTTIVPGVKSKYDYDDLQEKIKNYSKTVRITAKDKANKVTVAILLILVAFSVAIGLWTHRVFVIPKLDCPESLKYFLPYVCYVIAFILFIFIILNITQCGRNLIVKFIQFANRWGLRLLMLFLDLLYIPVITNLVTVVTPEHFTCGKGYYLQYSRHKPAGETSAWFPFVNHSWDCLPCYPALVSTRDECQLACSGKKEWRILGALNLRFFDDVLIVDGGILLFNVIAFLIGIPVLWRIIIRRNRSAIKRANVYGKDVYQKWSSILDQLQTTGIFLFFTYKINCYNWSLILIFVKLLVMIITTLAGRVNSNIYWALPVLYFLNFMTTLFVNPDLFGMNYFLNLILYALNFGFSIVPLLPIFGFTLPQNVILYISIGIVVIPILATLVMLCCKKYPHAKHDPTFLTKKQIKKIKKKKKDHLHLKRKNFNKPKRFGGTVAPNPEFKMYDITHNELLNIIKKRTNLHDDEK